MLQINYVADDDLFISCGNGNGWEVRRRFTVDVGTTMNVFICNMGPLGASRVSLENACSLRC